MLAERLQQLVGEKHGWKLRAAAFLEITRPTLDKYLAYDSEGRLGAIPKSILDKLELTPSHGEGGGLTAPPPSIVPSSPYDMVNLFAAGLAKVQEHIDHHGHIQAPYPHALVRGFNVASALNIEHGTVYPTDLASLARCAAKPVFEWCESYGFGPKAESFIASRLLENGEITPDCILMAGLAEADAEKGFYEALMNECKEMDQEFGEAFYTAWRKAVIDHPVVESPTVLLRANELLRVNTAATKRLIDYFYEHLPVIHAEDGKVALCPLTKTRLRKRANKWVSELRDPRAEIALKEQGPTFIEHTAATLELKRPARVFWAIPGWHELRLHETVQELGWRSELWPRFDSVDLLISGKGGANYAVDVKDHISPVSLAGTLDQFKRYRKHNRILVIPDYLADRAPHYRQVFAQAKRSALKQSEDLLTVSEFLDRLEKLA